MNEEDANLQSLFSDLNQVSRGTIIRERAGGGTGGGSEIVEGSMDPNSLMIGNPYIAKNVVGFNQGGVLGRQAMSNPYLDKVNQLVGLQQMVNVGKGMMGKALMEEAVTDSLMAPPIAKHGMKRKYVNGGVYNEGGVADEEVVSKDTRLQDLLDKLRSKSTIFGQIAPPRQSLGERVRPLHEMWEKVRAGEIPASTMFNLTNYRPPVERNPLNPLNPFGSTILGTTMQLPYWQELIDRRRQKAQDTLEQNYFNEMLLEQNRDVEFKKEGTPIANKGMKMKKRYTQGGRF